jgi:stage IV sporulation protein FB
MNFGTPIPLGKTFGVMVRLDVTLFLLAAFYAINGLLDGGLDGLFNALMFAVLLFFSVYLHEMGHAAAGSLFGIGTLDVTLSFFGGYTRYSRAPRTPLEQAITAFGGPATNLLIAAILYWYATNTPDVNFLVWQMMIVNLFLGVFNLLPGFPLDGGHIAAAVMSKFMRQSQARVITGYIGVGIGLLLIALSLQGTFGGPLTIMVGILLIIAASQEIQMNQGGRF